MRGLFLRELECLAQRLSAGWKGWKGSVANEWATEHLVFKNMIELIAEKGYFGTKLSGLAGFGLIDLDGKMTEQITIRSARSSDLDAVYALDEWRPEEAKISYWRGIFDRYAVSEAKDRFFLVAEMKGEVVGFIIGEVRAWEFGSPPCGWVFALSVAPKAREHRLGTLMFDEMCARLKGAGVATVRTMVDRENRLNLSFFRGQGMRSGRYLQLEKELD